MVACGSHRPHKASCGRARPQLNNHQSIHYPALTGPIVDCRLFEAQSGVTGGRHRQRVDKWDSWLTMRFRMSRVETRPLHCALIPWVIALVAMLGLNSLAPDLGRSARRDSPDEIKPSELAQQTPAGRILNFQVSPEPSPCDGIRLLSPSGGFLSIDCLVDAPVVQSLAGAVQGRAPPVSGQV